MIHFASTLASARAVIAEEIAGMQSPAPVLALLDPTLKAVPAAREPFILETSPQWEEGSWIEARRDGKGGLAISVVPHKPFPNLAKGDPYRPGTGARMMTESERFMTLTNLSIALNRKDTTS